MSPIRPAGSDPSAIPEPSAASRARARKKQQRGPASSDGHTVPRNEQTGPLKPMEITWRDGSMTNRLGMSVPRPLSKGPAESRTQALEAASHLKHIDSMIRERWNRAGWDDRGGDLTVVVNQKGMGGNAYFASYPDGKGEMGIGVRDARIGFKQSPAYSPSILFHEYTHGIVGSELRGMPDYVQPFLAHREHNAINESIADVLSTGLLGTDWRNGQEIRDGSPLRDLADPSIPTWNAAVRRDTGLQEHTLSGVLSRAAVVAAESAGTLPVVDAWYAGIDRHYRSELLAVKAPGAGRALGAWVRATMRGAEEVGGKKSALVEAVRDGWEAVGLGRYASDEQLEQVGASDTKRRDKR